MSPVLVRRILHILDTLALFLSFVFKLGTQTCSKYKVLVIFTYGAKNTLDFIDIHGERLHVPIGLKFKHLKKFS